MKDVCISIKDGEQAIEVLKIIEEHYPEVKWRSRAKPTEYNPEDMAECVIKNGELLYSENETNSFNLPIITAEDFIVGFDAQTINKAKQLTYKEKEYIDVNKPVKDGIYKCDVCSDPTVRVRDNKLVSVVFNEGSVRWHNKPLDDDDKFTMATSKEKLQHIKAEIDHLIENSN